jgi:phospholipid/cholesterol/gamma-HCH transport system ATP-binding protein
MKLKFEDVSYFFSQQEPILSRVDFDFPENEVCWIKSEEGEGKSTVLQILAALEMPKLGQYWMDGASVRDMSFEEFLPYRLKIGYSFDYGGLISNRSLRDNLLLPLLYHRILPAKKAYQRVDELIQLFDFKKSADERPAHVSGRLRKLTCVLRSLVHEPDLLVLDDPFVGLGQETSEKFIQLILNARENGKMQSVFLSSYDEKLVQIFSPSILQIDGGQIYLSVNEYSKKVANL